MEFLTFEKNNLNFSGKFAEARALLQIPETHETIHWQNPLKFLLDSADNVPEPWQVKSVEITSKGLFAPEEIKITLSKDSLVNLVLDLDGLHLRHSICLLRCKTCPLPKNPEDVPTVVSRAQVLFLEELVQLSLSL